MRDRLRRWLRIDRGPDPTTTRSIDRANQALASLDRIVAEEQHRTRVIRLDQMRERRRVNLIHDRLTARPEGGD